MREHPASILVAQLQPMTNDALTSAHLVAELLIENPDAELAIFPELFLNGNSLVFAQESAVSAGSRAIQRIRKAARSTRTAVIVGAAERSFGFPSDAAVCIDEMGEVAGIYRKVHLSPAEHRHLAAGSSFVVVPLAGLRVAPLIADDLAFPEPARAVARAGIDLLVTIAATEDVDVDERSIFVRARAIENRTPHVYVNRVGDESGRRYGGESTVVDAAGEPIAALAPLRPEVRLVKVPIGDIVYPDYPRQMVVDVPVLRIADHPSSASLVKSPVSANP